MSEFNASNFKKEEGGQGPDIIGTTELTSPYFMVPPSGTTAQRPSGCAPGTLRFNTDIGSLEYFKGDTIGWEQIVRTSPNLGGRAIYGTSSSPNPMEYITISTLGNAIDFGDLTNTMWLYASMSSPTRALFAGGYNPSSNATYANIDYVQISTTGNGIDFGDLTAARHHFSATSNGHGGLG